uniref:Uncharacterized protein n=1 Tax=Arundo donax TaxID=35708 RepID=A0A0A9AR28_ARUDO
MMHTVPKKH